MSRGQSKIRRRRVPLGLLAHRHRYRFGNLVTAGKHQSNPDDNRFYLPLILARCIDWHMFSLRSDRTMLRGQSKIHRRVPLGLLAHRHRHRFGNLVDLLPVSTNRTLTIIDFTYR